MKLEHNDVRHIASLARLELTSDEVDHFSTQLASILDYVEKVGQAQIGESSDGLINEINVLRDDAVRPSLDRQQALKNAPMQERGFVKVQTVFSEN